MEALKHLEKREEYKAPSILSNLTRSREDETEEILKKSTFTIHQGSYVYAKAAKWPEKGRHFNISQDDSEITVVTKEENLRHVDVLERNKENYALIALRPSVPFYSVGFLAAVSNAIAKQKLNLLIVSTYSKDYILVNERNIDTAKKALASLGLKETRG